MSRVVTIAKLALPLAFVFATRPTRAGVHQVWDEAHAFKPDTIVQVDQLLDEIHEKYHKDLMIETFASIPDDMKQAYQQQGTERFFETWGMDEGRALQLNGLLILVCAQPRHIYVALGLATRQKAFIDADRLELLELMTPLFHQKEFDKGILAGAQFVRDRIDRNLSEATTAPSTRPATRPAAGASQANSDCSQ